MVYSIEVQDQTECGGEASERPEQTSNISQVVQQVVYNALYH